jgi:hypothetical protein
LARANKAWRLALLIGLVVWMPLWEGPSTLGWAAASAAPAAEAHRRAHLPFPESLRDGDLVLRRGTDLLAAIVLAQGQSTRFSHVGMVLHEGDRITVVHAIPPEAGGRGGVLQEPLAVFASAEVAADVAFYRVEGLDEAALQRLRTYLLAQLGKPFDLNFSYADDTQHYCTELVLKALRHAGFPIHDTLTPVTLLTIPEAVFAPDSLRSSRRLRAVADATRPHF